LFFFSPESFNIVNKILCNKSASSIHQNILKLISILFDSQLELYKQYSPEKNSYSTSDFIKFQEIFDLNIDFSNIDDISVYEILCFHQLSFIEDNSSNLSFTNINYLSSVSKHLFYLQSYNDFSLLYDKLIVLLHLIDKAYASNQSSSSSSIEELILILEKK
jgi:hypothetical protein